MFKTISKIYYTLILRPFFRPPDFHITENGAIDYILLDTLFYFFLGRGWGAVWWDECRVYSVLPVHPAGDGSHCHDLQPHAGESHQEY